MKVMWIVKGSFLGALVFLVGGHQRCVGRSKCEQPIFGITAAARISSTIPTGLGRGSVCPKNVRTEARVTNPARTKSKLPALLAALCSAQSSSVGDRSGGGQAPPKEARPHCRHRSAGVPGCVLSKLLLKKPLPPNSSRQSLRSESELCDATYLMLTKA